MKLIFKSTLLLGLIAVMSTQANAQRFAYVDSDYILSQMPSYKSAQNQIDEKSKKWQEEIDNKFEAIDKLYKQYQAEKVLLTKDMQTKRENEIIEKEREAKKLQNDKFGYEGELFKKREELIKPVQDKVYEAINKVAKNNGLDFIFDKSGDMLMLVSNPKYDRSDEVLEELGVVPTKGGNSDDNNLPPGAGDTDDDDLPPR
ncbi:MAG: OmpH family outer membrane protein [Bacteroidia bacterium]|jgi:outer membrane protein|tara:strand:- start:1049 stop:1651 length:603 start_codon:yes stop_codon:yes gene_type:complete